MATDVSGLDPLTVSLRDYIDNGNDAHDNAHRREREATSAALSTSQRYAQTVIDDHFRSHDKEHESVQLAFANYLRESEGQRRQHGELHTANQEAVRIALDGVQRLAQIHSDNHTKEHGSHEMVHQREHEAARLARRELDVRLQELLDYRTQIREQTQTFMPRTEIVAQIEKVTSTLDQQSRSAESTHTRMERGATERFKHMQDQIDTLKLTGATDSGAGQRTAVLFGAIISTLLVVVAIANFLIL